VSLGEPSEAGALRRIAEALERMAPPAPPAPDFRGEAFVWHPDPDRVEPCAG
jgi:hypothetical protein